MNENYFIHLHTIVQLSLKQKLRNMMIPTEFILKQVSTQNYYTILILNLKTHNYFITSNKIMDNEDIFDSFMRNPTGETYAILDQDDINMINIIIFRIINYGGVFNIEHRNKYYVVDENLANQMADARYFTSIRAILPFNGTLISQKTLREIDEKEYRLVSSLQVKLDRAYLGTKFTGKLPES